MQQALPTSTAGAARMQMRPCPLAAAPPAPRLAPALKLQSAARLRNAAPHSRVLRVQASNYGEQWATPQDAYLTLVSEGGEPAGGDWRLGHRPPAPKPC